MTPPPPSSCLLPSDKIRYVPPAQDAHDFMLKDSIIDAVFLYQARLRIRSGDEDALD